MLEQQQFPFPVFIADIGGTNGRFAYIPVGAKSLNIQYFKCADYQSIDEMLQAFFDTLPAHQHPEMGAIAVACPVESDTVQLTNLPWRFSINDIRTAFNLSKLVVVNDYEAIAKSLPYLGKDDVVTVGPTISPTSSPQPKVALGPGSGLGCAGLIPHQWQKSIHWVPVPGEAGHMSLAAQNAKEDAILTRLRQTFGHVSGERVVSGPGIVSLYNSLYVEKARHLTALIDIDPEHGDILPAGGKPYPNELQFQKFEGLTDISFDGQVPKVQPTLVDAIIPKKSSQEYKSELDSYKNLDAAQVSLLALQARDIKPNALFQKSLPTLPENVPDEIKNLANDAMDFFFQFLGNVAGNLALSFGAKGGVYLAGGILPKIDNLLMQSSFRTMFQAKGRFSQYLADVPTYLIVHPCPALVGLTRVVWEEMN